MPNELDRPHNSASVCPETNAARLPMVRRDFLKTAAAVAAGVALAPGQRPARAQDKGERPGQDPSVESSTRVPASP